MKENKRRKDLRHTLLLRVMILAILLITISVLSGCAEEIHSHNYTETRYDDVAHWKKCNGCLDKTQVADHVYDDESDTTCNICGFVRTGHIHVWADEWDSDSTAHWHKCTISGCDKTKSWSHSLTIFIQSDLQHWKKCVSCGYISQLSNHDYRNDADPKCDTCGYVRDVVHIHEWVRDRNGDQHWYMCLDCPETKEKAGHIYEKWKYVNDGHWQECFCGYKTSVYKHIYDNNLDFSCNVCDYIRHKHEWLAEWSFNNESHWHKCANCSLRGNVANHSYKWKYSAESHWKECICGMKTETESHVYDNASDPSCNTCGYIRKLHDHVWQTDWSKDENHHWHDCTVKDCKDTNDYAVHSYTFKPGINGHFGECICGQKTQTEDHVYDNDWDSSCNLCGYMRYIYIPTPPPPHVHEYTYKYDDDEHWLECSCGEEKTDTPKQTHHYIERRYDYNDSQHWQVCDVCDYQKPDTLEPHQDPSSHTTNSEFHWKECVCGLKTEEALHQSDNIWHHEGGSDGHWQECAVCHKQLYFNTHDYVNGVCTVCKKQTSLQPTS